jgi:hypothetical protein
MTIAEALVEVKAAFAPRPLPTGVHYCTHCLEEREMARILATPYSELTPADIDHPLLWSAYWTWGDWPSLAYYVPRLLEFYYEGALGDDEMLFSRLLLAAHPDRYEDPARERPLLEYLAEPMRPEERSSIFRFVQAVLEARLQTPDFTTATGNRGEEREPDDLSFTVDQVAATVGFLAAFDAPIAPLLERWKASENAVARGHLCLLIARCLAADTGRAALGNSYLDRLAPLPENRNALDALLFGEAAWAYLVDHLDDARLFGPDRATGVDAAFSTSG